MHWKFYLLVTYIATVSNMQSRLYTFQFMIKTKTITKLITKKSNNCHYN